MAKSPNILNLIGNDLLQKGVVKKSEEVLQGKDIIGLYFSAHWCPPCRKFTPKLVEFYNKHHEEKKMEIVFVSSDSTEDGFNSYFSDMPWTAIPFNSNEIIEALKKRYNIRGIPTLHFIDKSQLKYATFRTKEDGKDGRELVLSMDKQ